MEAANVIMIPCPSFQKATSKQSYRQTPSNLEGCAFVYGGRIDLR